jgi:hypothetical protein
MPTNLNDLLVKFRADVALVNEFVRGDATVMVHGDDGNYPSLAKIAADAQLAINAIDATLAGKEVELNTIITNFLAQIADLVLASQNSISALQTNAQADVNTLLSTSQTSVNTLLSNGQTSIANFITTNQAQITNLLTAGTAAIDAMEAIEQTDINALIAQTQAAIQASNAAQLAADNFLASLVTYSGVVAKHYRFNSSLVWNVKHNMNCRDFSVVIKNDTGETVHENSIDVISADEININFTEVEVGVVYVTFYMMPAAP